MANGQKPSKMLPSILSNVKVTIDLPVTYDKDTNEAADVLGRRGHITRSHVVSAQSRSVQPTASTIQTGSAELLSFVDLHHRKDTSQLRPLRGSAPPAVHFGEPSTSYRKKSRKKTVEAQITSQNLRRQNTDMAMLFMDTPITNAMASSREIVIFLLSLWEMQLCASYRTSVKISTSPRQDVHSGRTTRQTYTNGIRVHSSRHSTETRSGHREKRHGKGSQGKFSEKGLIEGVRGKFSEKGIIEGSPGKFSEKSVTENARGRFSRTDLIEGSQGRLIKEFSGKVL